MDSQFKSSDTNGPGARRLRPAIINILCAAFFAGAFAAPVYAQQQPTAPSLLVATPDLDDPVFRQVVILLLPGAEPPLMAGVIINQPTTIPIKTLLPNAPARIGDVVAYFGGPVEMDTPVMLLRAAAAPPGAIQVTADLYWMGDLASVKAFTKSNPAPDTVRLYYGRAQWLPIQLRGEVQSGAWYVEPVDPSAVFSANPKTLWRTLVERAQLQETRNQTKLRGGSGARAAAATLAKLVR
ncbi:MAG: YqgE/AlgH family protein [Candidatus Binataceae bacterium]